jgi:hypothetical protein
MTEYNWNDPALSRLVQRIVDARIQQLVGKRLPEVHYGSVVAVDEDDRSATVRYPRPTFNEDLPGVKWGDFTPTIGQEVRTTYWPKTGERYIDSSMDPVAVDSGDAGIPEQVAFEDAVANDYLARFKLTTDSQYRLMLDTSGSGLPRVRLGGGSATPDVNITRYSAGQLAMETPGANNLSWLMSAPDANAALLAMKLSSDSVYRLQLQVDSAQAGLQLGDGAAARDVRLRRSATKLLTIDDNAGGAATVNVIGTLQEDGTQVAVVGHAHSFFGADVQIVTGTTGSLTATANTDITVTWPSNFASTAYTVLMEFEINDATQRNPPGWHLRTDSSKKAVGSCVVTVRNNAAAALNFTYRAIGILD